MYLLEHDAKELLARHDVAVPEGRLIGRGESVERAGLPAGPWVVKGQLAAGGRGTAGIIQRADTVKEVAQHVDAILAATVKGRTVETVRIEQQVQAAREVYIAFLLDPGSGAVRVIVSASGGMDIEQVARDQILTELASPDPDALADCVRRLADRLTPRLAPAVRHAGRRLARAFLELEAMLLEINPLFVLNGGLKLAP